MTGGGRRLMRDWRGWLLAALTAGFALAAVLVPAIPQPLSYHAFADCRAFWAIPNFFNVVSNLPFLIGGALGLHLIWKGGGRTWCSSSVLCSPVWARGTTTPPLTTRAWFGIGCQ
jgi:hypothetical protein